MKKFSLKTRVVHASIDHDERFGSLAAPIYTSSTFKLPSTDASLGYTYSRDGNPTRTTLTNTLANLENAKYCFAFSSGMAAISTIIDTLEPNSHLLVSDDNKSCCHIRVPI